MTNYSEQNIKIVEKIVLVQAPLKLMIDRAV